MKVDREFIRSIVEAETCIPLEANGAPGQEVLTGDREACSACNVAALCDHVDVCFWALATNMVCSL